MTTLATTLSAFVGGVTVLAAVMVALALLAWRRERRTRFLLVAGAFAALLARSALLSAALFTGGSTDLVLAAGSGLDLLLVLLLYAAVVR